MDSGAVSGWNRRHLQALPEPSNLTNQKQMQLEEPTVQLPSSPHPVVCGHKSNSNNVLVKNLDKELDQRQTDAAAQTSHRAVQVASIGLPG